MDEIKENKTRKRKLSNHFKEENAKLLKTSIDEAKEPHAETDYAPDQNNEGEVEKELNISSPFHMKIFREKLRDGEFITELRHFLFKAAANSKIISQYINSGGKILELVQVLERVDKNQLFHISYVFNAIQLTLIEILSNSTHLTQASIQACSYLLSSHRSSIEKLLNSHTNCHKKSVLKLLTAIVTLEPQFGRDILTAFNVISTAEILERFTKHTKNELEMDKDSVRTCYIHFILAYLIEGNIMLVRNLLDHNQLVMAVVSGLIYDNSETVCLVLSTMQKFVLKTALVSKTKKFQVFNVDVVKQFLKLYDWKGPKYCVAMFNKKIKNISEEFVNVDELDLVSKSVHEFLIVLLTSRKFGIAFQCLGYRRTKTNATQKRILFDLNKPWTNKRKSILTIEILKACPELARTYIKTLAYGLDPNKKQHNWFQAIQYFSQLIVSLTPNIIRVGIEHMNVKEVSQIVKALCISPDILIHLRNKFMLKNENLNIRHKSTELLYLMLKQCNQYIFEISSWKVFSDHDIKKIKFEFINDVFVMCPSVENILLSLHLTLQAEGDDDIFPHLECVLDLLLIITKSIPSFIEATSSVINYMNILQPIYELHREHESSTRIELKAIKLILALEPKTLSPNTKFFHQVIHSFLNVFVFGASDEQSEAKQLLRSVLLNTGLFENGLLEVDLWLEAFKVIDTDRLPVIKDFFVNTIVNSKRSDKHISVAQTVDISHVGNRNISELFFNIENGITMTGSIDVPILGNFFLSAIATVEQEENDAENVMEYLENVAFYLYHFLPLPHVIEVVLKKIKHKYTKYMKKWSTNGKPGKLTEYNSDIFMKFYSSVLDKKTNFLDVFKIDDGVKLKINDVEYELHHVLLNETQVMILIYVTTFVIVQLNEQQNFDQMSCQHQAGYLKALIEILYQLVNKESTVSTPGLEVNVIETMFSKALRYIFCSRFYFLNNFNIWNSSCVTDLIVDLTKHVKQFTNSDELDEILIHYQTKLTNQIAISIAGITDGIASPKCDNLLDILDAFSLKSDHCIVILQSLIKLPVEHFVSNENEKSIYIDILAFSLKRLADLKTKILDADTIRQIANIYIKLIKTIQIEINYEQIEEALHTYLLVFYHNIGDVPNELFEIIFQCKKLTKASVKLACLFFERKQELNEIFLRNLPIHLSRKELIYPLLNIAARKNMDLESTLLSTVYAEFKNGISKTIEKPQKAGVIYRENVYSSLWLIEQCMPINECIDFTKKSFKFDSAEVYQLQIIKAIHIKVLNSDKPEIREQSYVNFLVLLIQMYVNLLKKDNLDYDKINSFSVIAADWLKLKEKLKILPSESFEKIRKNQSWLMLAKSCLKFGIQVEIDETSKKPNEQSAILLKTLGILCDHVYADNSNSDEAGKLFEMTISHSEFFNLALLQHSNEIKTYLMYVLLVLIKKNNQLLKANHVPVFLGAYHAKLSICDRFILAILHKYEQSGISMHEFKPFLWGESAIAYYSLHENEIKTNLNQEPPMSQVMSLVDRDIAENTLKNFPIWRKLNPVEQLPDIDFIWHGIPGNEYLDLPNIANNRLEKCVNNNDFNPELRLLNSLKDDSISEIYDPAFFVPLMSMAFAPEAFIRPVAVVQNGLLAMTFAGLSSQDKELRLATAGALIRYRSHLELSRFIDSRIWFHLFDCVQRGLSDLTTEMRKHKKSRIPRIPFVAGLYLGQTINILFNPLNEMYRPLSNYLLFQNSFNFLTVPEFNILFNSPDVNHITYRHFIIEVIRDGIKCGSDFTILMSGNIFKALFGFYNTPMSTRDTNLLILTVINASVKIPKSTKVMINNIGLIPWLNAIIDNVEFFQFDIVDGICSIMSNMWYSVQFNRKDYDNVDEIFLKIFYMLMKLCPNLSTRTTQSSIAKYLNIFSKVSIDHCNLMSESNLDHLITCGKVHIKTNIWDMNFIKQSDDRFAESKYMYVKQLRRLGLDEITVFIDYKLREIVVNWLRLRRINNCS